MTTQHQTTMRRHIMAQRPMIFALVGMGVVVQPFFAQTVSSGLMVSLVSPAGAAKHGPKTYVEDLHPFTHFASIPADSDPGTIKFEKVKATKVFTERKSTTDAGYCDELQFRDPGGSMYCPYVQQESPVPAYEVTYSYKGEPLASDEYGNRNFTLQVYFRPEELPSGLRKALAAGKVPRAELATYFQVSSSRRPVRTVVIDEANSSFCEGNYMDGNWIQNDSRCRDKINVKRVTVPSSYITVRVEPDSSRPREAVASR